MGEMQRVARVRLRQLRLVTCDTLKRRVELKERRRKRNGHVVFLRMIVICNYICLYFVAFCY